MLIRLDGSVYELGILISFITEVLMQICLECEILLVPEDILRMLMNRNLGFELV